MENFGVEVASSSSSINQLIDKMKLESDAEAKKRELALQERDKVLT